MSKSIISFFLFFFFLSQNTLLAQENYITRKTATGKAKDFFEEAKKTFTIGDLKNAIKLLDKAIGKEPNFIDAYFQKAAIYRYGNKLADAEIAFEKALAISKTYEPEAIFSLAETERMLKKDSEAIAHYKEYLELKTKNQDARLKSQTYINTLTFSAEARKKPVLFNPVALDSTINTTKAEYFPCLTADGETMIFTRNQNRDEDFYLSKKINDKWTKAYSLLNVNSQQNEGAQSISADGRTLVYTGCDRPTGIGSCDLFVAEFLDGKWLPPKNMGPIVNSKAWDSQPAVSADGKTIYFASTRDGGLGKSDIWVTTKSKDGVWSAPKNVGAPINTPEDDNFPFFHWDDQTFYYCTGGYPGMGGLDIFLSRKNEKGEWTKPENLGFPINTTADESSLVITVDGTKAYFTSDKKAMENREDLPERKPTDVFDIDIYSFDLYEAARPKAVTYVKGNVFDIKTRQPLRSKADIIDLEKNVVVACTVSDGNGSFLVCLPAGKNYGLNVNRKNYAFYSDNFELTEAKSVKKPFLIDIPLIPLEKTNTTASNNPSQPTANQTIVLKNIFFETGSAKLRSESTAELERLKNLLDEYPTMKIQLNGHTDNVGNDAENMTLSTNRAKAVYDYLIKQKIAQNRLYYKGFGKNQPISSNDTPEGRQENRRTAFLILSF